ncbi:MAG: hypothetical protein ACTH6O_06680, partial [Vibrio toranzoniae]
NSLYHLPRNQAHLSGEEPYIYGVDAMQSYCMALKRFNFLINDLVSEGYKFYYPGFLDMEVDILSTYF